MEAWLQLVRACADTLTSIIVLDIFPHFHYPVYYTLPASSIFREQAVRPIYGASVAGADGSGGGG